MSFFEKPGSIPETTCSSCAIFLLSGRARLLTGEPMKFVCVIHCCPNYHYEDSLLSFPGTAPSAPTRSAKRICPEIVNLKRRLSEDQMPWVHIAFSNKSCPQEVFLEVNRAIILICRPGGDPGRHLLGGAGARLVPRHARHNHRRLHTVGAAGRRLHVAPRPLPDGEEAARPRTRPVRLRRLLRH